MLHLLFSAFFVGSMLVVETQCQDSVIKSFVKEVRSNIPDDIFKNLYSVSFVDDDDVKNAVMEALKEFGKEDQVKIPEELSKELEQDAVKVEDAVTPMKFYQVVTMAVARTLTSAGLINSSNASDLGKSYADELVKADKSQVKEEDVKYTLPAVADATGKFFQAMGLSGNLEDVLLLANNLIKEAKNV